MEGESDSCTYTWSVEMLTLLPLLGTSMNNWEYAVIMISTVTQSEWSGWEAVCVNLTWHAGRWAGIWIWIWSILACRWFGGKQLEAHMYDGVTSYHVKVKETWEEQEARLEAFAKELEEKESALWCKCAVVWNIHGFWNVEFLESECSSAQIEISYFSASFVNLPWLHLDSTSKTHYLILNTTFYLGHAQHGEEGLLLMVEKATTTIKLDN